MKRTKQGVAVIIFSPDRQKVLLLKRGPECRNEVGRWENPGGQLDPTISPTERAKQKVEEELGVQVEIVRKLFSDESQPVDSDTVWIIDVFEGRITHGIPRAVESAYCSEIRWFSISDLAAIDLTSYTRSDFIRLGFIKRHTPTLKRGVAVIIFNTEENQILLMKRGPQSRNEVGKWENPGGALLPGEKPEAGANREVIEELGVTVDIDRLLYHDESESADHDYLWSIDVYKGWIASGTPSSQDPNLCSDISWYPLSELSNVDLTTYTRRDFVRLGFIST